MYLVWVSFDCLHDQLQAVTVWAAVSSHGINGPYFMDVETYANVYRQQVIELFQEDLITFCELNNIDLGQKVFQQDGATAHTGHGNLTLLQELFPGRLISRESDFPYPARCPYLSLRDAFLWRILEEQCFIPVPHTLDALCENIERVMHNLTREQHDAMLTRMLLYDLNIIKSYKRLNEPEDARNRSAADIDLRKLPVFIRKLILIIDQELAKAIKEAHLAAYTSINWGLFKTLSDPTSRKEQNEETTAAEMETELADFGEVDLPVKSAHKDVPMSAEHASNVTQLLLKFGLRENLGKDLNQVTYPDRDSNPGHLVSRPDALAITPQV
ncbi:hypothetical protein ANN_06721 [Periplaneta americana]|uniref:Uncharacterized protein n=1 Tax=Periplaneta americana TaxID=6978 RepID=A0ABQ8TG70_PERAM|nr:hypothetical protein ANN_06721 [Periplaneta americana]